MKAREKAYLLLADGLLMEGVSIGKQGTVGGEICFNTGMTGYQEIYTDPSYYGQIIVSSTAHIGNYGVLDAEQESDAPTIRGLVVSTLSDSPSRASSNLSDLSSYLEKHHVVGIADVDTRKIIRHIRKKGVMNAIISSKLHKDQFALELTKIPTMRNLELASIVSTTKPYYRGDEQATYRIAVLDLGIKKSILNNFVARDCYCCVFPSHTSFEQMHEWNPDGYFISNGPGDPSTMDYAVNTVREMIATDKPVFGICLGHQIMALSCGVYTYKMRLGHRGLNHPVKNLLTQKNEITSQNHGFAVSVDDAQASKQIEITHRHLNDNTVMGTRIKGRNAFSVQYHPEASPGPHDSRYLFDQFIDMLHTSVKKSKHHLS